MQHTYTTQNTCSSQITFELDEENRLHNVAFLGGCNGNLKAIASLVEGQTADEVIARCEGILCGRRPTSCSDQLAHALKEALAK